NIGTAVLIPEIFIPDLQVRLGIYRRLGDGANEADLDGFAAQLADRLRRLPRGGGPLPEGGGIQPVCRAAHPPHHHGRPHGLRDGRFASPEALVQWITAQGTRAKLRPDMKIVIMRDWDTPEQRLKGSRQIMSDLVKLATV